MNNILDEKFDQFNSTPIITKLKDYFTNAPIEKLFHIDVYGLADQWGIERKELLEIFFRAVNFGICDMHWEFHCPSCGGIARESLKLMETASEDYCPGCKIDFNNTLDDNIEVFFNINESLRAIPEEIKKQYSDNVLHTVMNNQVFHWQNERTISGLDCINNNAFRDIFGHDTLPEDQSLAIKFSTILFTDIKGSTAMYERLGDARAFKMVKDHFEILFDNIKSNGGTPIKTIGDAVMGVFNSESEAIDAAFKSQKALMNYYSDKEEKIEVKIGLHSGPALVVTLNNTLDYFGSTVNTAARIQGLSHPNQIVFSEPLFERNKSKLGKYVGKLQRSRNLLKGLSENYTVFHASCDSEHCRF